VIADVDGSLAKFLHAALGKGVEVSLETPTVEWAGEVKRPAVSCFLHRVVEDIGRRSADWADERNAEGRVSGRQPPVRHYQLHYQVSAWAKSIDQEHQLLGRVMEACLSGEVIPATYLVGVLEGEHEPLLVRLGVPVPDPGPQAHDVWSSLGVPMRASLDLMLVAPLRPQLVTDIAPPAEELSMVMESIGGGVRGATDKGTLLADRRWTAFRIREKSGSDDAGLDRIGDGV
jgi:predicted transcriptional regulator